MVVAVAVGGVVMVVAVAVVVVVVVGVWVQRAAPRPNLFVLENPDPDSVRMSLVSGHRRRT